MESLRGWVVEGDGETWMNGTLYDQYVIAASSKRGAIAVCSFDVLRASVSTDHCLHRDKTAQVSHGSCLVVLWRRAVDRARIERIVS
jgi:hypothetical protein